MSDHVISDTSARGRINISSRQVFDVLALVAQAPAPIGVSEVARQLRIPPSTAHRALATLEGTDFLHRYQGGTKFEVGVAAFEVCHGLFDRFQLRTMAQPYLERLAASSGETTALNVRVGWFSLRIAGVEGHQAVHRTLNLGSTMPLHASTGGRAMLAFATEGLDAYAATGLLTTAEMEQSVEELRADMAGVAERGYSCRALIYPEARAISFPVHDPGGRGAASMTITGPASRFDPQADPALIADWRATVIAFENEARGDPHAFVDPFGHLPPEATDLSWSIARWQGP